MAQTPISVLSEGNNIDVADILTRFNAASATADNSIIDLATTIAAGQSAASGIGGGAMTEYQGQKAVNTEQMKALVKRQADDAQAAALVGMTPGAPSQLIVDTISQIQSGLADLNKRGAEISKKQDSSFLDDPLQFLGDQFSVPFDIAAYNSKEAQVNNQKQQLSNLADIFSNQARVNQTVDVATGEQLLDGMNKIALGKAQQTAASSALKVAELGLTAINMRQALTDSQFKGALALSDNINSRLSNQLATRNANLREAEFANLQLHQATAENLQEREFAFRQAQTTIQMDFEREREERVAESNKLDNDLKKIAIGDKTEQDAGKAALQLRLDKTTTLLGIPRVTYTEYQLDPGIRQRLEPYMLSPDIQTGYLGPTVGKALDQSIGFPLNPGASYTRDKLQSNLIEIITAVGSTWKQMSPESQEAAKVIGLSSAAAREKDNITISGGLYSPPNISGVVSMMSLYNQTVGPDGKPESVPKLSLLEPLRVIAEANRNAPLDPNLVINLALDKINKGEATQDQMATEIATLYQAIGVDNNSIRQYGRFRIPGLGPSDGGFRQTIANANRFNMPLIVDLMNPTDIRNALTRASAAFNRTPPFPLQAKPPFTGGRYP